MRVSSISRVAAPHLVGRRVERDVREAQDAVRVAVDGAPEQRADAREQLLERERLDEVVVGARVETRDAIARRRRAR